MYLVDCALPRGERFPASLKPQTFNPSTSQPLKPMKTYIVDDSHLSKPVTIKADDVDECLEKYADRYGLDFGSYRYDPDDDSASCRMVTCGRCPVAHWVYVEPEVAP